MKTALARLAHATADRTRRMAQAARRHPIRTAALLPALVALYVLALVPFTPSIGDIKKAKAEQPTVVLTSDGKQLAEFKRANRDWVPLADMSKNVVHALIATEDKRFYDHHGIDFARTAKAVFLTVSGDRQGGSTLTQQLARNLYPEEIGRAVTITRKVKEAITALKIEAVYSKDEILETYLNTVPFLYNAFGIEMAARTYFDKSAKKLDELEAATLVGMLKGTSHYNPVLNPERSLERRNIVLVQMVKDGKLTQARYDQLRKRPLRLDFERQPELLGPAPHLAQQLRRWLIDWADQNGYDIHSDGLRLHTSIDSRLQAQATRALEQQGDSLQRTATGAWGAKGWAKHKALARSFVRETPEYRAAVEGGQDKDKALDTFLADSEFMERLWKNKTRIEAGFMAVEPGSGQVRAWVGSRDFREDQFDHVQQARRQPGSTFKPFVYGAAFSQGISPAESFMDQAVTIQIDKNKYWSPGDVADYTGRMMTLREGLMYSKNSITSQLMQRVGPGSVARLARAMGVRQSKLDEVPSLALGTSPVTLREMVASYATLANSGSYVEPTVITRVEDRHGNVLARFSPRPPEQALPIEAAHTLLDVLRAAIDQGTGAAIRSRHGIQADVAGKTGTTQENTDGWFILMHPQLVAGAWVGFNDSRINMPGDWGQGSRSALPMVGNFYQAAFKSKALDANAKFAVPKGQSQQMQPDMWGRVGDWLSGIFQNGAPTEPVPLPEAAVAELPPPRAPDLEVVQPGPPAMPEGMVLPEPQPYEPPRALEPRLPDWREPALPRDIVRAPEQPRAPEALRAPEPESPRGAAPAPAAVAPEPARSGEGTRSSSAGSTRPPRVIRTPDGQELRVFRPPTATVRAPEDSARTEPASSAAVTLEPAPSRPAAPAVRQATGAASSDARSSGAGPSSGGFGSVDSTDSAVEAEVRPAEGSATSSD